MTKHPIPRMVVCLPSECSFSAFEPFDVHGRLAGELASWLAARQLRYVQQSPGRLSRGHEGMGLAVWGVGGGSSAGFFPQSSGGGQSVQFLIHGGSFPVSSSFGGEGGP